MARNDALDMITGAFMKQQGDQAAQNPGLFGAYSPVQAGYRPSADAALRPVGGTLSGNVNNGLSVPVPPVPELFDRPQTVDPQPIQPPAPAPALPAPPPGPAPSNMNQALMLQNLLGGLEQTGLGPLFGAFGVTGGVSAAPPPGQPLSGWSLGHPTPTPWGGFGTPSMDPGGLGGTGVGWNPWLFGAENPNWSQHQGPQSAWGTPFSEATSTVFNALSPELQALPAIAALFGAPLYSIPTGLGGNPANMGWAPSWFAGNPSYFGGGGQGGGGSPFTGVNDPTVNAAIQALMEYIQGGGAPTPTTPPAGGTTPSAT
jgi:hypothetical protein